MEGSKFIMLTGKTGAKIAIRVKDIVALEEADKTNMSSLNSYNTNVEVAKPDLKITTYYVKQTVHEILDRI